MYQSQILTKFCHGLPPLHLKRRGEKDQRTMVCVHSEYLIKESTEQGLPGGAVVKGAVLQRQLCHQSPWVRAQALS